MLNSYVKHAVVRAGQHILVEHGPTTIGSRIRFARESKNLALAPVAKAAGITVSALSQIENDVTKSPKPATIFAIADALDVDARYLVFGHHDRAAPSLTAFKISDTGRFRVRKNRRSTDIA